MTKDYFRKIIKLDIAIYMDKLDDFRENLFEVSELVRTKQMIPYQLIKKFDTFLTSKKFPNLLDEKINDHIKETYEFFKNKIKGGKPYNFVIETIHDPAQPPDVSNKTPNIYTLEDLIKNAYFNTLYRLAVSNKRDIKKNQYAKEIHYSIFSYLKNASEKEILAPYQQYAITAHILWKLGLNLDKDIRELENRQPTVQILFQSVRALDKLKKENLDNGL